MTKSVIFSPHCDDAFLAMGGMLIQDPAAYEVVDIFGTCAWTTTEENYTSEELTRMNQAEERSVAHASGVKLSLYEFPEALLRNYRKWNTKRLHVSDRVLASEVLEVMRKHADAAERVFLPMAPGNHVDHVIVHSQLYELYDRLISRGIDVYLYEDLPYSWYGDVDDRIAAIEKRYTLRPITNDITDFYPKKEILLKMYTSQLGEDELRKVREYAASLEPNKYCERVWQVLKK